MNGLVQGYSYWTFSDIFEENYFPSEPFHGGFGLQNIYGIAKPAYRAFELLHDLGTELLPVDGQHPTVDAWFVRGRAYSPLVLTNFNLPRHAIQNEPVRFALHAASITGDGVLRRIDQDHGNAKRLWQLLGEPAYLNAATIDVLRRASQLNEEALSVKNVGQSLTIELLMPPLSVASVRFSHESV